MSSTASSPISNQVFLFSSAKDNPDKFFQGYCFYGSDYIYGEPGAASYRAARGVSIRGGEDGCYVTVERTGRSFTFDVDHSGNKKLFYYWDPGFWVVSNSIFLLVQHLRENSIHPTANFAQLAAAGHGGGSALNQLVSYHTVVNGVFLVPLSVALEIGRDGFRFVPRLSDASLSYSAAMSLFLGTWTSRLQTLLRVAQVEIHSDLTGGLDSRAVFALLKSARDRLPDSSANFRIKSGLTGGDATDLEIATEICARYGLAINGPRRLPIERYSANESFESWRQLCLGAYHPIYFPVAGPRGDVVMFGGGGGENYRRFYRAGSVNDFVAARGERISNTRLRAQLESEAKSTFRILSLDSRDSVDPLIMHYRAFRNRFHAGRASQYGVLFSPLGSSLLEHVARAPQKRTIPQGLLNYEIINSLLPELLAVRFDNPSKTPSVAVAAALSDIAVDAIEPGEVFGEFAVQADREHAREGSPWTRLREEFHSARKRSLVSDFWGGDFLNRTEAIVERAAEERKLGHAVDGQPISAVLASALTS